MTKVDSVVPTIRALIKKFGIKNLAKKGWEAGGVLIFASMVANVLNLIYNVYLGNAIDVSEFGTVSLINSIFAIASVITSAYGKSISYKTAFLLGKFGVNVRQFARPSERIAWSASVLMTIVWLITIPLMSSYFKIESAIPFILFIPAVSVSFISSYYAGFLNGSLKFSTIGLVTVVEALGKLILAIGIIKFNLPSLVYAAVPASTLITFLLLNSKYKKIPKSNVNKALQKSDLVFPKHFFITSVINKLWGVAFLSTDILLAKYFLTSYEAGQYALLSLSGKIIFFLGSLFSQFINPFVSKSEGAKTNSRKVFARIFSLIFLATLGGYIVIGLFGEFSVVFVFKEKVRSITYLLPAYGLAIGLYTLTAAIINYHQVKKRWLFTLIGLTFAVIEIVWVSLKSNNLYTFSIAYCQVIVVQFVAIIIASLLYDKFKKLDKSKKQTVKKKPSSLVNQALKLRAYLNRIFLPRKLKPLSSKFGFDRGTPIDRYWIESFLKDNSHLIKGRCLEVTDSKYTFLFGGSLVTKSDVIDIDPKNKKANITADLRNLKSKIKDNTYDCIILTHVLGMIDDYGRVIMECKRILKKGGVLIFTGSCLGPQLKNNYSYWRFTPKSVEYIMQKYFKPKKLKLKIYGNILTAQAFIVGMAQEELTKKELEFNDERFPCVIGALAVK